MKIVLSGSVAIDRIMVFEGLFETLIKPDKLHVLSIAPLVNELRLTQGGVAGNMAYSLSLLGETPALLASVGKDSRSYIKKLARKGVDTSGVYFSKKLTASFSVLTDQNDCQVGGFYPGAMSDANTLTLEKFKDDDILMVVSAHDPAAMMRQVGECQKYQKRLFFDVGQQSLILSGDELRFGIKTAEILIVNDYEMGLLVEKTGWSEDKIASLIKICVVTLGEQGSRFKNDTGWQTIPAVTVKKPVDPTGAGDAFRSGFIYGYVRDWPIVKCLQLASVVASFVVEKLGTQEHRFTKKQIEQRFERTYNTQLTWN
jgi:adenosine kinase